MPPHSISLESDEIPDLSSRTSAELGGQSLAALTKTKNIAMTWLAAVGVAALYAGGLYCIVQPGIVPAFGIILLSEAMILAWYLSHEAAHYLAFRQKWSNMLLGAILSWPIGTAYFPFEEYRLNHIRHHVEKIDIIGFNVQEFINKLSPFWRGALTVAEGVYIPAIFFIVKIQGIAEMLKSKGADRRRAIVAGFGYGLFFLAIMYASPAAIAWMCIAVLIRIHCIRFVDAFQHTYDQIPQDRTIEKRSRQYEQNNTFSFPVFRRYPVLNLIFLNFGYHNAHHAAPGCPWYRLPKADGILAEGLNEVNSSTLYSCTPKIGFWEILSNYHRHRIDRLIKYDQENVCDEGGIFSFHQFRGALTDNLLG